MRARECDPACCCAGLTRFARRLPHARSVEAVAAAPAAEASASFDYRWYAVGFSEHLREDEVFPMRLWGEPMVLYRQPDGQAVCVRDVCPHRAAPLSMGDLEGGVLRCFYHGWAFGEGGKCVDVPTFNATTTGRKPSFPKSHCAVTHAVTEHEGLVWVWRGSPLTADASKLPTAAAAADGETLTVDTTLDYDVSWTELVENSLHAPHAFWLADGSAPPLAALGVGGEPAASRLSLRAPADEGSAQLDGPTIVSAATVPHSSAGCMLIACY